MKKYWIWIVIIIITLTFSSYYIYKRYFKTISAIVDVSTIKYEKFYGTIKTNNNKLLVFTNENGEVKCSYDEDVIVLTKDMKSTLKMSDLQPGDIISCTCDENNKINFIELVIDKNIISGVQQ